MSDAEIPPGEQTDALGQETTEVRDEWLGGANGASEDPQGMLFGEEDNQWWVPLWQGMPEFAQRNLEPWQSVTIHLRNETDRAALTALTGQTITGSTRSIWYPQAEVAHMVDKRFETDERANPRYPVYVPTKGRWASALTIKTLERLAIPYYAVVQPQEVVHYRSVVQTGTILTLPEGLDGLVPARNWIKRHSIEVLRAARHWQIDDNIDGFYRLFQNLKTPVATGAIFRAMEDFSDRYENVVVSGPNYFMFVMRKNEVPPLTLNTRVYSCSLINNSFPYEWRDVFNDDTDLCLRILKDGHCVVLFNAFLCMKATTMSVKGGNTDIYQADGRLKMAESLQRQHPDCVTITEKWGRWQHHVDYRRFRGNILVSRPGLVIRDKINNYGMHLAFVPKKDAGPPLERRTEAPTIISTVEPRRPTTSALDFLKGVKETPAAPAMELAPEETRKAPEPEGERALASPQQPTGILVEGPGQPNEPDDRAHVTTLVIDLKARGHRLLTRDGKFFVSESSRLSQEDRDAIKQYRDALVALAEPWDAPIDLKPVEALSSTLASLIVGPTEASVSLFANPQPAQTLAQFLGSETPRIDSSYVPDEPPSLDGIDEVVLNLATTGFKWADGDRPVGLTISTMDGQLCRFLPFAFGGGNLDEATVRRWAERELCGKKITNSKTKFDVHHMREWGVDLEAQGCTFSDIQHTAALLDDHRKRFAIDVLAEDYLPGIRKVERVDESRHASYYASEVAAREKYTAELVWRLRDAMYPELDKQELREIQQIEDDVIPAVVEMEKNGSPIDVELLDRYSSECHAAYEKLILEVSDEAGFAFEHTARGWKRLLESLSLPIPDSFDEAALKQVDHPLVRKGQFASQHASLNSKIHDAYKRSISNGLLRYEINQLRSDEGGTVSGRFSIEYVQQVPNRDNHEATFGDLWSPRSLFIPGAGQYLEADAAQIEYRLFAHYANNPKVLAAYAADPWLSFHMMTWEMIKAYKPDMLYGHQKNFNFARQYGARSIKLAVMMGFITEKEGEEIRAAKRWDDSRLALIHEIEVAHKKMMPEAEQLLERASHLAKTECDQYCKRGDALHRAYQHRGYVRTLRGRRSRFPTNYKTYIGLNRVLQGTGADIMKIKLALLHRERKQTGFVMRITNHDAVLGDAIQPETLARVSKLLNAQCYPELKVPVLWKCKQGTSWAEAK